MKTIARWLLGLWLLVIAAVGWAAEGAPDPAHEGPFAVGFTAYMLTDSERPGDGGVYMHRPIPVNVWYPADQSIITGTTPSALYPFDPLYEVIPSVSSSYFEQYGIDPAYHEVAASAKKPFPVLLFSPGWGMSAWQYASVAARLASHGFVVAVLYHFGDRSWPWEPYDHLALAAFNRPRDVSLVLTDLLTKNASHGHLLAGSMRPDQVAAGGHSLGGYAAMVLAGGDDSVCTELADEADPPPESTCAPSYPDPRIKAIVPLDGSGWILRFDELARIRVPYMGIGQEWTQVEDWHTREHAAIQGHPSYRVDVFNSNHMAFSDICEDLYVGRDVGLLSQGELEELLGWMMCTGEPSSSVVHRLSYQYAIAFLKTELARDDGYAKMLTPGWALTRETLIEFFVTEKRNPNAIDDDWPGYYIYFKHQPGSERARAEKEPATKRRVPRLSLWR